MFERGERYKQSTFFAFIHSENQLKSYYVHACQFPKAQSVSFDLLQPSVLGGIPKLSRTRRIYGILQKHRLDSAAAHARRRASHSRRQTGLQLQLFDQSYAFDLIDLVEHELASAEDLDPAAATAALCQSRSVCSWATSTRYLRSRLLGAYINII